MRCLTSNKTDHADWNRRGTYQHQLAAKAKSELSEVHFGVRLQVAIHTYFKKVYQMRDNLCPNHILYQFAKTQRQ